MRRRKVRSSLFPPCGKNCAHVLAPPFPTEPAALGFGGGPLGFAVINTNRYGPAPAPAEKTVQAKISFDYVEFYHNHHLVSRYHRNYGRDEELYDWTQYQHTTEKVRDGGAHSFLQAAAPAVADAAGPVQRPGPDGAPAA